MVRLIRILMMPSFWCECTGRSVFIFLLEKKWICAMRRHHTEPNSDILLTRNLPFDSDVRQWSYPLMIPLQCLWAKSNNWTCGECGIDVTWFYFLFCICSLTCTVQLLFHSLFTFSRCPNKTGWLQNEY